MYNCQILGMIGEFIMDSQNNVKCNEYMRDSSLADMIEQVENRNTKNYIKERILPQMKWYSDKSKESKRQYYNWMKISILFGAMIPVASVFADGEIWVKVLIAILGAAVTAINAINSLHNFRDLWLTYRKSRENLLRTLYCYFNNAGIFSQNSTQEEKDILLVNVCEEEINRETGGWFSLMTK